MPDTQNELYAQDYSENIMQLAQQKYAKLWPTVYQKSNITGKNFFQDQIGQWSLKRRTGRNPQTPSSDPNLSRRMGIMENFHDAVLLDRADDLRYISDPKSAYSIAGAGSIGRGIDDVIIPALGGDAKTGETGSTTTALPSTQKIAVGTVGLTFNKVKQAGRILNDNDVEAEDRYFVTSPQGIEDLLGITEATSSDFNTLRAIMDGQFHGKTWMGFQWIMSTRLENTSTTRHCFAYHKYGVCAGLAVAPIVRTDEREDLSYSWQIYYALDMAATRLEEKRVVQVDILES